MGTRSSKGGSDELAALLRERREAAGMSRRDLADASGLSYPYISQLETAYRLPSPKAMQALARVLEVPVTELFEALPQEPSAPTATPADGTNSQEQRSAGSGDGVWQSPRPARRSAGRSTVHDGVRAAIAALEAVDPADRLAALSEVQAAVVTGLVRDRTGRA